MNLMDYSLEELTALLADWGEPRFRAAQVYGWLVRGIRPEQMVNLPKPLREKLADIPWGGADIVEKRASKIDDTTKYLLRLMDGELVEAVLMRYHHGNTLCLSTQVGCRMGCAFCASTLEGRVRNLAHGEMLSTVLAIERDETEAAIDTNRKRQVTNLVLMGSGEPLDNYENVVRFLWRVSAAGGLNISPRNISLSTCGLVPEMKRLVEDAPAVTLCVSLHAHDDETRSKLMPINKRFPIREVVAAAADYANKTGRRAIFEYALIAGVNDAQADAAALRGLLKNVNCHVNLIPLNPVKERNLTGTTREAAKVFCDRLNALGQSATVRRELGTDIEGACGQLRRRHVEKKPNSGGEE